MNLTRSYIKTAKILKPNKNFGFLYNNSILKMCRHLDRLTYIVIEVQRYIFRERESGLRDHLLILCGELVIIQILNVKLYLKCSVVCTLKKTIYTGA